MCGADLVGRRILVLGAGGRPGRQAARELADAGARVVAADRDLVRLRAQLGAHANVTLRQADHRDPAVLSALVEELVDLDALIWAAGGAGAAEEACVTALEVATCWSVFGQFAPAMAARGGGSMVALSGMPDLREAAVGRPGPWRAVREVVRDCAVHLEPQGVRVNAVLLGEGHSSGALSFLASEASRWLTGSAVAVQSGWSQIERLVPTSVPA